MDDYEAFYREEILLREKMLSPPFCDICVVTLSAMFEKNAKSGIIKTAQELSSHLKSRCPQSIAAVLGPAPAPISKMGGSNRWRLMVKCVTNRAFREAMEEYLGQFYRDRANRGLTLSVDINPYSFL